ncbi:MFS transporter [Xanthomonas sp. CFBP 8445]|uniref:MFS transporter n=1 Tax=Xanthomonas sp. CFBP 8445 TaxID=2971236 RepID=UPI0021DF6EB1|nr:MFS transporter [Xanthomonas sp. CFBP 8445]UYC12887.1 MFS transporter [Xanthomonas sp. CFBP 8445]
MPTTAAATSTTTSARAPSIAEAQAEIGARLERLPITRKVWWARNIVGAATFFDGYTVIAIAYAMPVLTKEWQLSPAQIGMILSAGYLGQLLGSVFFGWLAERIGRLHVLLFTILLFVSMDVACLFAGSAAAMIAFRFVQGIGTGGEVPVASAYINELIGSKKRGRFFLLYEVMFLLGLVAAGGIGYFLVPAYGWKAMFMVGLIPAAIMIPLRFFMFESPRWLAAKGRYAKADAIVTELERSAERRHGPLPTPVFDRTALPKAQRSDWRELFGSVYRKRTLVIWSLWFCSYLVANGIITWLPTLYRTHFGLSLQQSIAYGFFTSLAGVAAAVACALSIDQVGRKRWYGLAFVAGGVPLLALAALGGTSAPQVLVFAALGYAAVQTITFSLYLYSAELYPTRIRAIGTGLGSAWLRLGSACGPLLVGAVIAGLGIRYVFAAFAAVLLAGAAVTWRFALETKGKSLEQLSP